MAPNARITARAACPVPVVLTLLDDTRLDGTGIDLSYGGISLLTAVQVRPGAYCAVRFTVPPDGADPATGATVLAFGQVIYSDVSTGFAEPDPSYKTGVQFINIEAASAAAIAQVIAAGAMLPQPFVAPGNIPVA